MIEDRTSLCHDAWRLHLLADSIDDDYAHTEGVVTETTEWFEKMLADDSTAMVDRLCAYESELDARDTVCKQEIERLRRVMEITAARRVWGRKQLGSILDRIGVKKLETSTRIVSRIPGAKRAEPDGDLPEIDFADPRYVREVPAKMEWSRTAILKALKSGEFIKGWRLVQGEPGVQVR